MSPPDERPRLIRIKPNLERRALIFQFTRSFFVERGFLEVETPVRVPVVAPEQHISPLESEGWFLSTSPELHMKRLMAAGYPKLFQFSRCFRRGESGRQHNPEFTMLEWYRMGATYREIISDTEDLLVSVSRRLGMGMAMVWKTASGHPGKDVGPASEAHEAGHSTPEREGRIDLTPPWPRLSVMEAFLGAAGWDPISNPDPLRFDTDLVTKVIPAMDPVRPVVLEGYPASMAALSRIRSGDSRVAERAEVFIRGLELANAYSELNDAREQRRRFDEEIALIRSQGGKASLPFRFLEAIEHFPECGGIALGMDRLAMLFCGADSIGEVMAFPEDEA